MPLARQPATDDERDALPPSWVALYKAAFPHRALRSSQARLLVRVAANRDFVGVAATGAGKSDAWLLPAAVDANLALEAA